MSTRTVQYQTMPPLSTESVVTGFAAGYHEIVTIQPSETMTGFFKIIYSGEGVQFASDDIAASRVLWWMEQNAIPPSRFPTWRVDRTTLRTPLTPVRHVYFVADEDGYIKIGSANSVDARLRQLQTGVRQELRLVASMPGSTADEFALHARFAASRVRGEWFRPTPELLNYIEEVAK